MRWFECISESRTVRANRFAHESEISVVSRIMRPLETVTRIKKNPNLFFFSLWPHPSTIFAHSNFLRRWTPLNMWRHNLRQTHSNVNSKKHLNIHYSLLKSNQASLKTFKSVECRLKYSQNKLWILKKYISKVGQIKYKKRNVQNVSTFTNIQKQYYKHSYDTTI